ncbi:MAG: MlaD family protein [Planctomycetota bacterium]
MAWPTTHRTNLLAGLFLVAGVVLTLLTTGVLTGLSIDSTSSYTVRFDLGTGVAGLKPGSAVTVGGVEAGRVVSVQLAESDTAGDPAGIDVVFEVDRSVTLRTDAQIELARPLLGTLATLNVRDVGSGGPAENVMLDGVVALPGFLADAGYGPDEQARIAAIISNFEAFSERIDGFIASLDTDTDPIIEELGEATEELNGLLAQIAERFPAWDADLSAALAGAEAFVTDLRETASKANDVMEEGSLTIGELRARVESVGIRVNELLSNADGAVADVREGWIEPGRAALEDSAAAAERARMILDRERVTIRTTLANLRIISEQGKLAAQEVRSEPWRLLQRPETKELREQLIYDSARAFAQAAGDLRDAAVSLDALTQGQPLGRPIPAAIEAEITDLQAELAALQGRLAEAGEDLLDRLDDDTE